MVDDNATNGILEDMWSWNGVKWNDKNDCKTPGKRFLHAMAYDKMRDKIILYGGGNGQIIFGDIWEWNGRN